MPRKHRPVPDFSKKIHSGATRTTRAYPKLREDTKVITLIGPTVSHYRMGERAMVKFIDMYDAQ
jgi:hypothetical protein